MKGKILSVVFDDFMADPRAKKFYEALKSDYEYRVLSLNLIETDREGINNVAVKININNRFLRLFKFWWHIFKQIRLYKPDYVLAHNFYVGFPCYLFSKLAKFTFAYDAYEFYFPRKNKRFSKRDYFFYYQERIAIKNASIVFAANSERARLMKCAYKLNVTPVDILNIPIYQNSYKTKESSIDIENKKVNVVYEGFISFSRFIDSLVDSLEFLPKNFELTIIGDGADSERLKQLIEKKTYSSRVHYLGRIPNSDILMSISKCDIGFVGYPFSDLNNIYCSPNKIYEYPAAGVPFVSTKQHPIWLITNKYRICEFYDPFNNGAQSIAHSIMKIVENYSSYCSGIKDFNLNNSWKNEAKKILLAFKK